MTRILCTVCVTFADNWIRINHFFLSIVLYYRNNIKIFRNIRLASMLHVCANSINIEQESKYKASVLPSSRHFLGNRVFEQPFFGPPIDMISWHVHHMVWYCLHLQKIKTYFHDAINKLIIMDNFAYITAT